jgi:hypothetical protein
VVVPPYPESGGHYSFDRTARLFGELAMGCPGRATMAILLYGGAESSAAEGLVRRGEDCVSWTSP